ncbi:MAG: SIMPL domain-containing protein [Pseudomonadota bacterium]
MRGLAAIAVGAAFLLGADGALAEAPPRTLTVSATGEAAGVPDRAIVTLGVEQQARTAGAALRTNSTATAALIEGLRSAGVAPRQMQTSGLSLRPVYGNYGSSKSGPPRIEGFTASNRLTVEIVALDSLGGVLDALVEAGANRIDGLRFTIADPAPLMAEARADAVAKARVAAETIAAAAGVTLGPIQTITEGRDGGRPQPFDGPVSALRAEAVAVPIERGESVIRASVSVIWQIQSE